jgi:SAM-dependent methyltransferase
VPAAASDVDPQNTEALWLKLWPSGCRRGTTGGQTTGGNAVGDHDRWPSPASAFNALGADYEKAFGGSEQHDASLQWLLSQLRPHSRILDVGSGTGKPTAATFVAAGHDVLGIDVSPVMVALAARQVPGATFRCADSREVALDEEAFDAVCSYFSLMHMSRQEQADLVRRLARALRPGGSAVLATIPRDVEDATDVFMGQVVRESSFAAEDFIALARGAGLTVLATHDVVFTPAHPDMSSQPQLFLYCQRREA